LRILFVHPNYPSQFRRLAPWLAEQGHEIVFLASNSEWHAPEVANIRLKAYQPHRAGGTEALHPYLRRFEQAVLSGQAAFRACVELAEQGWHPDWIINHVGFGPGLYLRDAFPKARRAGLFEWYYNAIGSDVDFLARGAPVEPDRQMRLRTWNAQSLIELADVDLAVTPTVWQQRQFPAWMRSRLQVIHEGIDWDQLSRLRSGLITRPDCLAAVGDAEIVTYVSRGFEEYRGFPQAMQALALLQQRRPRVQILIAGSDIIAYGAGRQDGRTWQQWAEQDAGLDPLRTHWLGPLQTEGYHQLLACSNVHLYLTVPFVLSWSLLEAMAVGCAIVSSATAPVQEVMRDGQEGLLCDFYAPDDQARAMERLLDQNELAKTLGIAAQQASRRYSANQGLQSWLNGLCGSPC